MKFTNLFFAFLTVLPTFVYTRELSEIENEVSRLDSPQDVAKFMFDNRQEIEAKLSMMDDNTRRKVEDLFRNSTNTTKLFDDSLNRNSTKIFDDSSSDLISIDDSFLTFILVLFGGNLLFV